jgi:hypothetical protein
MLGWSVLDPLHRTSFAAVRLVAAADVTAGLDGGPLARDVGQGPDSVAAGTRFDER